ncbi:amino acid/amine (lysine) APC transporter [Williamsoniiplasma luminosum]|uniref:Amino acid/amine (Lysine) APC transporter n=1 Tax=Williamsoniiplasma luminosum TaxID=214888 RepID=A0A2K8NSC1_9MOLU|nr:amino acid permease [Williamsoniiplasma luminosum]ATZ16740.1 amino acid/amine (lysine) APC transporter [Williamsoniiplasma luminosum]
METEKLKRKYGFWSIFMMAISATIGSSILITFSSVGSQVADNPILMILAWVIGGLLVLPEMILFAETATSYPGNGTSYYWIRKAKWNAISFWFGWVLVLFISATAIATSIIALGGVVVELTGIEGSAEAKAWYGKLIGIGILFLLVAFQIFVPKGSGRGQIVFTLLKMLPIGFVLILAMIKGNLSNSFNSETLDKNLGEIYMSSFMLLPAIALTSFAYSGMEAITYVSGEVINPKKNIPRALIWSTIAIILIYTFLIIGLLALANPKDWTNAQGSGNVWTNAIMHGGLPKWVSNTFNILTGFIFIGSLNAYLVYHSRLIFKMSEEKDLFKIFQLTYKKTNMPWFAIVLMVLISLIYVLFSTLLDVMTYLTLALAVLKFITQINIIYLRLKDPNYVKMYNNYIFWFLALVSSAIAILMFVGTIMVMFATAGATTLWWNLGVIGIMFIGLPIGIIKVKIQKKLENKRLENNQEQQEKIEVQK